VAPELVRVERRGAVALLVFEDPERRNAMTEAMGRALASATAEIGGGAAVRAVVLTGAGAAFSAGGDLDLIESRSRQGRSQPGEPMRGRNRAFMRDFYGLFLSVRELPCPSVAAIQGAAIGAGLAVALACDLRVAARDAKLGLNFARLGIHPGMGSSWTLPRLVGPAHAGDLLLTGRLVDGAEAERMGLVNQAVEREAVVPRALAWAAEIAECAPLAVRGAKRALAQAFAVSLDQQLDCEGLLAAREKRAPRFVGR